MDWNVAMALTDSVHIRCVYVDRINIRKTVWTFFSFRFFRLSETCCWWATGRPSHGWTSGTVSSAYLFFRVYLWLCGTADYSQVDESDIPGAFRRSPQLSSSSKSGICTGRGRIKIRFVLLSTGALGLEAAWACFHAVLWKSHCLAVVLRDPVLGFSERRSHPLLNC